MVKVDKTDALLQKVPAGIAGLDEITLGGLPKGRPTLIAGNAGSGKTVFAMEFIVQGATQFNEPGVFVAFEETPTDLAQNFTSLGWDLNELQRQKKLIIDYVYVERSEIEETGAYDLEGLFIRLGHAIDSIGAKRVVLDTIEVLFSGLSNTAILRAELRRLFRWLKEKGVTAVVTGERGDGTITRYGLEEYVADCVILLDNRMIDQIATRRLRILKYRGSLHGTNEYPFLVENTGIAVMPITSVGLDHEAPTERVSTGIAGLDEMMGGKGYLRGSSILVSGTAGTGKTSIAASFVDAACRRGEQSLYFAFEESPKQIVRNMRSVGIDLQPWVKNGLLVFHAGRPTQFGLETHLAAMTKLVRDMNPSVVVVDPISSLTSVGDTGAVRTMLMRLIDFLKSRQVVSIYTNLTGGEEYRDDREVGISSLIDTWISVRNMEHGGERNRGLYVLKSRGMAHSNQVREFVLTDQGVKLEDVYLGPVGILAGTARALQRMQDESIALDRKREVESKLRELDRKREMLDSRISVLHAEFLAEEESLKRTIVSDDAREVALAYDKAAMQLARQGNLGGRSGDTEKRRSKGEKK